MDDWDTMAEQSEKPTPDEGRAGADVSWSSRLVAVALFLWIITTTFFAQLIPWMALQFSTSSTGGGLTDPDFIATVVQAVLQLFPLTVLALVWQRARYRLIFRLWACAALFSLLASVIHLPGSTAGYRSITLQIIVAAFFIVLLLILARVRAAWRPTPGNQPGVLAMSIALAPLLLLAWVPGGAFGGPLEFILNLIASLLFGVAAALLLRQLANLDPQTGAPSGQLALLGGFVAGAILAPMAASFGFGGVQILMFITVPATGWIVMRLIGRRHATAALAIVVAASAAGPLLFVDPREMALVVSFGLISTVGIAFRAAFTTLFLAWITGATLLALDRRGSERALQETGAATPRPGRWLFVALPAWLLLFLIFAFTGNRGFHGDRLFVILRDQADVSEAEKLGSVADRRQFVYQTLVDQANQSQQQIRAQLEQWGFAYTPYYLVNAIEVDGGPLLRVWLENQPEVEKVLYSPILRPAPPEGAEPLSVPEPETPPWNISMIGADAVWESFGVRGAGIVVGQSDSGVQWDHPQLIGGYRGGDGNHDFNWYDPWFQTEQPTDTGGHGTHTLGTVLGATTGVAPDATWYGCANLARNLGSPAYYLDCMQFMLAPFPLDGDPFVDGDAARGANVLNNSWGCPALEGCDDDSLLPAVVALRHAGTFVVVSAGNDGPECATINSPLAIYDQVLSVGAVDQSENVTFFSSRGPVEVDGSNRVKPDIVAPGLDILSAYPGDGYRLWQGTSMAGPHLAGVVALMWSANAQLIGDIATTEQILLETAQPLSGATVVCGGAEGEALPNNLYGYGLVDAYAAVERALAASE